MNSIANLLTDENALRVAEDILNAIEKKGNKDTLDFDFRVKNGIMEKSFISNKDLLHVLEPIHGLQVPSPNTWFSFDTNLDSMLGYIKDTICSLIEKEEILDKEYELIPGFLKKVINLINQNEKLNNRLKNILRKIVLDNGDEILFPLKDTKLILFEFGSKEDYGDMIKVKNYSRVNKATGKFIGEKSGVAKDLLQRRRDMGYSRNDDTKKIYSDIVIQQRAEKNPIYENVLPEDIEIVTEAKECHVDIFADYSPLEKELLISKLIEVNAEAKTSK
jgi:hypothetical protein